MLGLSVKLVRIGHTLLILLLFFFFGRFISAYVHAGMHCHSAYVCGGWRTLSGVGSLILLSVLVLIVYSRLSLGPCASRQFSVSASQFARGAQRLQMCAITSF